MDSAAVPCGVQETSFERESFSPARSRLSLRSNFIWTLSGTAVYALSQWGILIVLAKLGSPDMVGQFVFGLAVAGPVFMLANLQLRPVQATDMRGEFRFNDYFGLRVLTTAGALILIVLLAIAANWSPGMTAAVLIVALAKAAEAFSDLCYGQFQQREHMDSIAASMISRGILGLLALAAIVFLTGSTVWGVAGMFAMWTLVLLLWDAPRCKDSVLLSNPISTTQQPKAAASLRPNFHVNSLHRLFRMSFPVGMGVFLASLTLNLPRYFVEHWHGAGALGYFGSIAYAAVGAIMVVGSLGQSARPSLARLFIEHPPAYLRLVWKLISLTTAICALAVLITVLAGERILTILYSPDYAIYADTFVWVMISVGFFSISTIMIMALQAARLFYPQIIVSSTSLAAAGITCWLLIPERGIEGAGIAMAVYSGIGIIASSIIFARKLPRPGVS